MGKPESPHPGRRGQVVERVRLRWVKDVMKVSWCELEEDEMQEEEKEEKEEEWKGGKEEIERKNKDSHSHHKFQ